MNPILLTTKDKKTFHCPSEYNKARLFEWMRKYKWFKITPVVKESRRMRGYLEAAVIPEYCSFQYNIDPRKKGDGIADTRRYLFKRDFNHSIITDRNGNPEKVPKSSLGRVKELLDTYTAWAEENGAKVPNPELYKMWRDKWSMDFRFDTYFDFLKFLDLDCDAMPSNQTLAKLKEENYE